MEYKCQTRPSLSGPTMPLNAGTRPDTSIRTPDCWCSLQPIYAIVGTAVGRVVAIAHTPPTYKIGLADPKILRQSSDICRFQGISILDREALIP